MFQAIINKVKKRLSDRESDAQRKPTYYCQHFLFRSQTAKRREVAKILSKEKLVTHSEFIVTSI